VQAGAGASAARVAIAAALGQKKCDVEDARASQHGVGRAAARRVMTRGIVGRQEVAREMLRRRAAVRRSSGRWQATWRGPGVTSARAGRAAGERRRAPGRHRAAQGRQGWRTWPGQRRRRAAEENRGEGERGRRRGTRL
jgi:hypothetical protein